MLLIPRAGGVKNASFLYLRAILGLSMGNLRLYLLLYPAILLYLLLYCYMLLYLLYAIFCCYADIYILDATSIRMLYILNIYIYIIYTYIGSTRPDAAQVIRNRKDFEIIRKSGQKISPSGTRPGRASFYSSCFICSRTA